MATTDRSDEKLVQKIGDMVDEGLAAKEIFTSQEVYELEKDHLFPNSWIFLAHESEISDPGDYVVRNICDDSFIVTRNENSEIQVFYNNCRHQGNPLCRTELGNTSHFRCCYHGWTYDNSGNLQGVPFKEKAYGEELNTEDFGLRSPRFDDYAGLIFACMNEGPPPLEEYLGEFTWYLDIIAGRSNKGLEASHPTRRIVHGNWKFPVLNNMSDHYHTSITHQSFDEALDFDTEEFSGKKRLKRIHFAAGAGAGEFKDEDWLGAIPESLHEDMQETLTEDQWKIMSELERMPSNCSIFPNTSFIVIRGPPNDPTGDSPYYTSIETFRPLGPDKTEYLQLNLIEKEAPQEVKDLSHRFETFHQGPGGMIDQDDEANFTRITESNAGQLANDEGIKYDMGQRHEPIEEEEWPGPGTVYQTYFNERNDRFWLEHYYDTLNGVDR